MTDAYPKHDRCPDCNATVRRGRLWLHLLRRHLRVVVRWRGER